LIAKFNGVCWKLLDRTTTLEVAISDLVVLGWFFGLGFGLFVGCVNIRQQSSKDVNSRQYSSKAVNKSQKRMD
jgi:hypothetical protein